MMMFSDERAGSLGGNGVLKKIAPPMMEGAYYLEAGWVKNWMGKSFSSDLSI